MDKFKFQLSTIYQKMYNKINLTIILGYNKMRGEFRIEGWWWNSWISYSFDIFHHKIHKTWNEKWNEIYVDEWKNELMGMIYRNFGANQRIESKF